MLFCDWITSLHHHVFGLFEAIRTACFTSIHCEMPSLCNIPLVAQAYRNRVKQDQMNKNMMQLRHMQNSCHL